MKNTSVFQVLAQRANTSSPEAAVVGISLAFLRKAKQNRPPVALRPLLDLLEIDFKWAPSHFAPGNGVASLESTSSGFRVLVHESEFRRNWRRARFTLAHEISHVLIAKVLSDKELIENLAGTEAEYWQLERLCNIGAAELLMPRPHFRSQLSAANLTAERLLQLYDMYLVSREALVWRIGETIPRGAVLRWRCYARSSEEANRLRVVSSYPPYQGSKIRPWLPKGATTRHAPQIPQHGLGGQDCIEIPELVIRLNHKKWVGAGVLTKWPDRHGHQPVISGFPVPDEPPGTWNSDLLLMAGEQCFFESK